MASKTFKISEETISKLEEISNELGLTWEGTFTTLTTLYTQQKAVEVLPSRKNEIEHFQSLINQVGEAFVHALTVNANTDERIRQEYAKRIQSMEERLERAEGELREKKEALAQSSTEINDLKKENGELRNRLSIAERNNNIESMLAELLSKARAEEDKSSLR